MRAALVLLALLALTGCETLSYYGKGIAGQARFYGAREPIPEVLARGDLDPDVRRRLETVPAILKFAERELALPVKGQYRDYVQLRTPVVAWNVFAAPELSLEPHRWCYLFRSFCVEYRGYFREADALAYAERLRREGHDTDIGGVSAFSTLGLLDDPVTSVLTSYPDDVMAMVLFHELAHAVLYVSDDTAFNESFASAVAEEGLRRWLLARSGGAASPEVEAMRAERDLLAQVALDTRARLEALYASPLPAAGKRERKREILAAAGEAYAARCADVVPPSSRGPCPNRDWFARGLNNARLNSLATYERWVPAFAALLAAGDGDFEGFYRAAEALGRLPPDARARVLEALMPAADAVGAGAAPPAITSATGDSP